MTQGPKLMKIGKVYRIKLTDGALLVWEVEPPKCSTLRVHEVLDEGSTAFKVGDELTFNEHGMLYKGSEYIPKTTAAGYTFIVVIPK